MVGNRSIYAGTWACDKTGRWGFNQRWPQILDILDSVSFNYILRFDTFSILDYIRRGGFLNLLRVFGKKNRTMPLSCVMLLWFRLDNKTKMEIKVRTCLVMEKLTYKGTVDFFLHVYSTYSFAFLLTTFQFTSFTVNIGSQRNCVIKIWNKNTNLLFLWKVLPFFKYEEK